MCAQRFRRAAEHHVAGRVGGLGFRAEFAALLVHDAFAADDDDVFLEVVKVFDALDQQFEVERMFGNQNDVRLAVRRAQRDVTGVPAHDFDDGDAPVAFRRGADALDAAARKQKPPWHNRAWRS